MNMFSMEQRIQAVADFDGQGFTIDENKGNLIVGLYDAQEAINEAKSIVSQFPPRGVKGQAPLVNNLFPPFKLSRKSEFIKLALRDEIIATVSSYMGFVPVLSRVHVFYSQVSDRDKYTQHYHCDWEDPRTIKLMLCVTDVTENDGPIHFVDADLTKNVMEKFKLYGSPVSDEELSKEFPDLKENVVTGPKGTMWFLDTCRCMHYGSRVNKGYGPRIWLMMQFIHPENNKSHHRKFRKRLENAIPISGLSVHQQMIIKA